MNLVLLLSLATINLVAGNIIPFALGLSPSIPKEKITSVLAKSSQNEPNCTAPFTAVGSSCLHFMPELTIDHEEAEFVCDSIGGRLAVINTATKLQDVVEHINPVSSSPVVQIAKILDSTGPSYDDNSGPDKVIDGDISSHWNVDIPNPRYHNNWFITFELKQRYTVIGAKIRTEGDTTHDVTQFKLESSDDLVNWNLGGSSSDVTTGTTEWQSFIGFQATGKYLRFTITGTQSGWQPWLSEISFISYPSSFPTVSIAKILDSTGPSYDDNSGPDKVIDGDISSHWNVDIPNPRYHNNWFITFELKQRYTVIGAKIRTEGDTTHDVTQFKLESSDDLVNWNLGGSSSDVTTGTTEWQYFIGFKATGKYLMFTITGTQSGWQPFLSEISFITYPNESVPQAYWIDGLRGSNNDWSFENSYEELPIGTPFWSTNENSGNCLSLSSDNSYYFTESECHSKLPSPLCEAEADFEGEKGTITSPNYPHNYPNNARNEWTITTENENDTITVRFEEFNTENGYDFLSISDGIDGSAPQLLRLAGSHSHSSIGDITSTGNSLHFNFYSDSSVTKSGFKLNWVASSASEITDVTCPQFYTPVGQDCFSFVFAPMSFNEAKITCASMNGQLGVVSNSEQLRSLYLYIQDQDIEDESFWLGGSDKGDEGHFTYVDGTDVPKGTPFWGTDGVFPGAQEPDGGDYQNCVALMADGAHFLRDVSCENENKFLCSPL